MKISIIIHSLLIKMVEGHSVHRVAVMHRKRLVGNAFKAVSPNGRFKDGALAIDGKVMYRIEAVGKNLFAFFGDDENPVVIHVHFGMAGNWAVYENEDPPEPSATNRLRLTGAGLTADLSAMTVQHGGMELFTSKRLKLGEDPLREDADTDKLWSRVSKSSKSIGALVMDQSFYCGPGNIYRAEILFKAGIHPDIAGNQLTKAEFDEIWFHTVKLLKRGFETGSILTVDKAEAIALGKPKMRRYIYNTRSCPRCGASIRTWQIASRTCYACPSCQPLKRSEDNGDVAVVTPEKKNECVPFNSHCAPETVEERLRAGGPERLTSKEIRAELIRLGEDVPSKASKKYLVSLLETAIKKKTNFISSEDAAMEKAIAGESLAVEHIAELAPGQARMARSRIDKKEATTQMNAAARMQKMTVSQLKAALSKYSIDFPSKARKAILIDMLQNAMMIASKTPDLIPSTPPSRERTMETKRRTRRSVKRQADSTPLIKKKQIKSEAEEV